MQATPPATGVQPPPQPRSLAETGLSPVMMRDILLKTIFRMNVDLVSDISRIICLPVTLIQELVDLARGQRFIEATGTLHATSGNEMGYQLTDAGKARALDALTLGEDAAASMGVNLARLRLVLIGGTALAVGASVSVAGSIGFVGLVVPHVLRPLVGAQPSRLLPASALGGAAVVLAADIAVRLIAPDQDLKLGVLTALIGAPFFLHLIWRLRGMEA